MSDDLRHPERVKDIQRDQRSDVSLKSNHRTVSYESKDEKKMFAFGSTFWKLVVAATGISFLVHFILLAHRFKAKPIITNFRRGSVQFTFPDVTICHNGPFSMNRSLRTSIKTQNNFTIPARQFVYGIKDFWKTILPEYNHLELNKYTRDDNHVSKHTMYQYGLHYNFGHESHELILDCMYKGNRCTFENFTKITIPTYLHCFTFSPAYRFSNIGGEQDGLDVVLLDADRRFILTQKEAVSFVRGLTVFIHSSGTSPEFSSKKVAQVGFHTEISLDTVEHRLISRPGTTCVYERPDQELCVKDSAGLIHMRKTFVYSQSSCLSSQVQRNFIDSCGCFSELFSIPQNLCHLTMPYCHYIPEKVILKYQKEGNRTQLSWGNYSSYFDEIMNESNLGKIKNRHECHVMTLASLNYDMFRSACPSPCSITNYELAVSSLAWPSSISAAKIQLVRFGKKLREETQALGLDPTLIENKIINNTDMKNMDYLRLRIAKLSIYPHLQKGHLHEEVPAYPTSAFLSDVGGILGLWVGLSVIRMMNFIEDWIAHFLRKFTAKQTD